LRKRILDVEANNIATCGRLEGRLLRVSSNYFDTAAKDADILAKRISPEDYENLKKYWENKSFTSIAFMLRRYGLEFKGLTYLEVLVNEVLKKKER
jgi:hypothetical protein